MKFTLEFIALSAFWVILSDAFVTSPSSKAVPVYYPIGHLSSLESSLPTTLMKLGEGAGVATANLPETGIPVEEKMESELSMTPETLPVRKEEGTVFDTMRERLRDEGFNEIINTGLCVLVAVIVLYNFVTVDGIVYRGWTAQEAAARIPAAAWNSYTDVLRESPIATKAATSATVYTIGDVIAQRTEGSSMGELDRPRVLRSLLAGLIGHGPLSHYWYYICDDLFDNVLKITEWWSFIPKVLVDQASWGPFWNNVYILLIGVMKFESIEKIWDEMKRTTIPLVVSGLKLWPLAHCVTYGLIPVENRLLWVDFVEIIWVTILATTAANASRESTKSRGAEETEGVPVN